MVAVDGIINLHDIAPTSSLHASTALGRFVCCLHGDSGPGPVARLTLPARLSTTKACSHCTVPCVLQMELKC